MTIKYNFRSVFLLKLGTLGPQRFLRSSDSHCNSEPKPQFFIFTAALLLCCEYGDARQSFTTELRIQNPVDRPGYGCITSERGRFKGSCSYSSQEPSLGEALSGPFQSGVVMRGEVFVTSKLSASDHEDPISALKTSLKKLQLEYLDLYLIHWPINLRKGASHPIPKEEDFLPLDIKSVWRGLEQCVELGLTKSIGVSNFSCKKIEDLLTYANIPPAVNQVEMHPLWQQKKLRDYCSNVKIHVSAYSPLGSSGTYYGTNAAMENTVIQEIAKRRGKTVAQVLLRWGLEQGVSVLPKSYNKGRIADNYQIFDWSLTRNDHEKISELEQKKIVRRDELINSTTSPYKTIEDLWDGEI